MKNRSSLYFVSLMLLPTVFAGCYSFKGTSIPPEANTFFVAQFEVIPENIPPTVGQDFSELLKIKILRESRLNYRDIDPDLEFSGIITEYKVTAEAPQAGETTSFNRLTIAMTVEYTNNNNEKNAWGQARRFSQFFDYPSNQNLIDVQDELLENIFTELTERIFNEAFTNW